MSAGLAAYLDHVQAQPTGWRAVFQARTGDLAAIAADIEQRSTALITQALGLDPPSSILLVSLAGWSALERDLCLGWLDHPEIPRAAVEEILLSSFLATLTAAAHHDPELLTVLETLLGPP
jgi:hypothetical protein